MKRSLQARTPTAAWLPGPGWMQRLLGRALGFDALLKVAEQYAAQSGTGSESQSMSRALGLELVSGRAELDALPARGALLLLANHPFGLPDAAVLHDLLAQRRNDILVLGNPLAAKLPGMEHWVIKLDPFANSKSVPMNGHALRMAVRHLCGGGVLVMFPAGEVAHLSWKRWRVEDPEWRLTPIRILEWCRRRGASVAVACARISGRNSARFQLLGLIHPRLRTGLLVREALNKRGRRVDVRIGRPEAGDVLLQRAPPAEAMAYLRWRNELLAPSTSRPVVAAERSPVPPRCPASLKEELQALDPACRLLRQGIFEVFCTRAAPIPNILEEIGRLRVMAFRQAGTHLLQEVDLDDFDQWYEHLFIWNHQRSELVAAYRLARTRRVRESYGHEGLYTATLFRYADDFLDRVDPGLELGRSFVRPEYQKSFAPLMLLWKGIHALIQRYPECTRLFGCVSLGNDYGRLARIMIADYLRKPAQLSELAHLVRARHVLDCAHPLGRTDWIQAMDEAGLGVVLSDIQPDCRGLPPLLKHYLRLGAKTLAIGVDEKFDNSMDVLMLVDFERIQSRLLRRFEADHAHAAQERHCA